MAALLVAIGLILGTAPPASLAAITTLQWVMLGFNVASGVPDAIKTSRRVQQILKSPEFARWVAANGECAIRLQPGLSKER